MKHLLIFDRDVTYFLKLDDGLFQVSAFLARTTFVMLDILSLGKVGKLTNLLSSN